MNKIRNSVSNKSVPQEDACLRILYGPSEVRNGIRLSSTEIFPNELLSIDWYEA